MPKRRAPSRNLGFVRCNCENSNCSHGTIGCQHLVHKTENKIQFIGAVCDLCYQTYPVEYRAENAPKREPMECSRCFDIGKSFITTDFDKFWKHVDEHRRRGDPEPL